MDEETEEKKTGKKTQTFRLLKLKIRIIVL